MAILASWSGNGLTDGTVITTATAGTGDTAFNQVNGTGGNVTVSSTGLRPPRIAFPALSSQTKYLTWTSATIGTQTDHAVRAYVELSEYGTVSSTLFRFTNSGADVWRVDVAGTGGSPPGQVRLRGASGTLLASSTSGLSTGTVYRLEGVASGGTVTLNVYQGDSLTVWATLTGAIPTTLNTLDIGPSGSTTVAAQYVDDIAFSNVASAIGPAGSSGPTITVWNGTSEVSATIEGVWNGTTVVPATFDQIT